MYEGRSSYSWLIRLVTGYPYTHAGLLVWWENRLMVLEAIGMGVVVRPFSESVRKYPGRVQLFVCTEQLTDEQRRTIIDSAKRELGKRYIQAFTKAVLLAVCRIELQQGGHRPETAGQRRFHDACRYCGEPSHRVRWCVEVAFRLPAEFPYFPFFARIASISSITRFIFFIVRVNGSGVVISTPAFRSRSIA